MHAISAKLYEAKEIGKKLIYTMAEQEAARAMRLDEPLRELTTAFKRFAGN